MSTVVDAFSQRKKNDVMKDTWGHMYPKPSTKYPTTITFAVGEYGDQTIVTSESTLQDSSPQRYAMEHSIFDYFNDLDAGVYKCQCELWFFKDVDDPYLPQTKVGKIIKIQCEKIL